MFFCHSAPLHPLHPPHLAHFPSFLAPCSCVIFSKKILWPSPPPRWGGTLLNTPTILHTYPHHSISYSLSRTVSLSFPPEYEFLEIRVYDVIIDIFPAMNTVPDAWKARYLYRIKMFVLPSPIFTFVLFVCLFVWKTE